MGDASAGLMKLRPVTFRYKDDQTQTLQYGLVAEEVAKVYPELISCNSKPAPERQTRELRELNQQHARLT